MIAPLTAVNRPRLSLVPTAAGRSRVSIGPPAAGGHAPVQARLEDAADAVRDQADADAGAGRAELRPRHIGGVNRIAFAGEFSRVRARVARQPDERHGRERRHSLQARHRHSCLQTPPRRIDDLDRDAGSGQFFEGGVSDLPHQQIHLNGILVVDQQVPAVRRIQDGLRQACTSERPGTWLGRVG